MVGRRPYVTSEQRRKQLVEVQVQDILINQLNQYTSSTAASISTPSTVLIPLDPSSSAGTTPTRRSPSSTRLRVEAIAASYLNRRQSHQPSSPTPSASAALPQRPSSPNSRELQLANGLAAVSTGIGGGYTPKQGSKQGYFFTASPPSSPSSKHKTAAANSAPQPPTQSDSALAVTVSDGVQEESGGRPGSPLSPKPNRSPPKPIIDSAIHPQPRVQPSSQPSSQGEQMELSSMSTASAAPQLSSAMAMASSQSTSQPAAAAKQALSATSVEAAAITNHQLLIEYFFRRWRDRHNKQSSRRTKLAQLISQRHRFHLLASSYHHWKQQTKATQRTDLLQHAWRRFVAAIQRSSARRRSAPRRRASAHQRVKRLHSSATQTDRLEVVNHPRPHHHRPRPPSPAPLSDLFSRYLKRWKRWLAHHHRQSSTLRSISRLHQHRLLYQGLARLYEYSRIRPNQHLAERRIQQLQRNRLQQVIKRWSLHSHRHHQHKLQAHYASSYYRQGLCHQLFQRYRRQQLLRYHVYLQQKHLQQRILNYQHHRRVHHLWPKALTRWSAYSHEIKRQRRSYRRARRYHQRGLLSAYFHHLRREMLMRKERKRRRRLRFQQRIFDAIALNPSTNESAKRQPSPPRTRPRPTSRPRMSSPSSQSRSLPSRESRPRPEDDAEQRKLRLVYAWRRWRMYHERCHEQSISSRGRAELLYQHRLMQRGIQAFVQLIIAKTIRQTNRLRLQSSST
jgi:hypothetical protein